jgi:hypothetical protein
MPAVSTFRTVREVSQARVSSSAPPSSASVELIVETDGRRGLDIRFSSPRQRPGGLERGAAACLEETLARFPGDLRNGLSVEAGEVRSLLGRDGDEVPLFSRAYRMASCRGVVLGGRAADAPGPFDVPWTGTVAAGGIDPSLPVLLGPSAVLALVSFALEVTGSHVELRSRAEAPCLTVVDTASSPYPPQHHPFEEDGAPSPDRPLIEDGLWRNREERAGDDVDPLFFLLTRPERALRPLAAATRFSRRNLAVRCGRTAPAPSPAILVDSWRVRVGPRGGAVPFHAWLSVTGPEGERLAVTAPVPLLLDPWEVLTRIQGASGPVAPAIDEDPIEGDGYGEAPTLATGLTLAALAAPETPR